jgi:Bax protein
MNNNLFGMKCGGGNCRGAMKGYSQFDSVEESVQAYVTNLNTHPALSPSVNPVRSCVKRIRK